MNKRVIFLITAICIAGAPGAPIAQNTDIPRFDIDRSCRTDPATGCRQDEMQARDQFEQRWAQFSRANRIHCAAPAAETDPPSYVRLLTCMQMTRDAEKLLDSK
jgi:hypothetical protein